MGNDNDGQLRVLIDTNVWLDFLLDRSPGREAAGQVIKRCSHDDIATLYPPRSVQDVFYLVGMSYKNLLRSEGKEVTEDWAHVINDQAWEAVRTMRELATVVGMNEADLWLACKYRELNSDLEDNLVLAAAERARADYLVTNDRQLLGKSTVAALTPEDMLAVLQARDSA